MAKPLVSVILLCYNQEDFIAQAIESVLSQTCDFDYEIILGDDASGDDTPRICQQYKNIYPDKIVLQLNETNKGICRNYFDCLMLAQGDYIADCAGDDFWLDPLKLQREVDAFRAHPDLSFVYARAKTWMQNRQEFEEVTSPYQEKLLREKDFGPATAARFLSKKYHPTVVLSAATYRKDIVLKAYQDFPDIFIGSSVVAEDLPITAVLLLAGPACYLPYDHLGYRQLDESVSHSRDLEKKHRFIWTCICQTYQIAQRLGLGKKSIKSFMKHALYDELHYAYQSRNEDYAKEIFAFWNLTAYRKRLKDYVKYVLIRILA